MCLVKTGLFLCQYEQFGSALFAVEGDAVRKSVKAGILVALIGQLKRVTEI
jgi:hypothetical protein